MKGLKRRNMHYPFLCKNPECEKFENIIELEFSMLEISDVQKGLNGKEIPTCSSCSQNLTRSYHSPHIKKFKGLITPREIQTPDGKIHKCSDLWRI